jgi:hypothetical protein
LPTNRAPPDDLCNVRRHRSRADLLKPASHRRLGWHRQDVRGGCRVFDPCWVDQARRWRCDDSSTPPDPASQVPKLCEPSEIRSAPHETRGDRGFESISLQRRVWCEPEFRGRAPSGAATWRPSLFSDCGASHQGVIARVRVHGTGLTRKKAPLLRGVRIRGRCGFEGDGSIFAAPGSVFNDLVALAE